VGGPKGVIVDLMRKWRAVDEAWVGEETSCSWWVKLYIWY